MGSSHSPPRQIHSYEGCLPVSVLESTIDAYFKYCHNQPYSFFHEANFRQKYSDGTVPDHLLFAILANAVRFSTESFFGDKIFDFAVAFANQSWKSIVSTCFAANQSADLHTVQTVTLLSIFDFTAGRSRHGSAWVKIGMAVRIAQDLKLMLGQRTHMPHSVQEEHRRVFWSIYLLDRLVSCGRGRPPAILDASCQLQLPLDDTKWRDGLWEKTLTLEEASDRALVNNSTHGPFARVIMIAQILGRTAQYMLQECNFRNRYPPWEATSDFAATESDLLLLETRFQMRLPLKQEIGRHLFDTDSIDQAIVGPIIFSRALFHLCYCILHHPFLLRKRIRSCQMSVPPSFLVRTFASGRQHANSLARHIHTARELGCYVQASFYGYCAVVSGSIAGLDAHSTDEETRNKALHSLKENITFLEDLSRHWANASLLLTALKTFVENSYKIRFLSEDSIVDPGLGAEDEDLLWSLVDYSTMSNASPTQPTEHSDTHLQLNTSTSWYELFSSADWGDIDVLDHDFPIGVDEVEEDRSTVTAIDQYGS
ncbi:uncharacterized protein Z519_07922 [Cladophialophora bantiana CBS 173.52]|uniref:Xylanolytic transcriptional activator regulatory domain-containing protein n=1 Tax=Cladophialophora bantiana (strain ATCC 10958 / CBS 173.52 / CDC B-1940 / NIH 8579) TaxID=1442370 RepID=A0A0D2HCR0_CLAB1|nr:uncharacterized protein Z519_07922 [Cladophialophora bantiana CBS 173.52]KIW91028.1 hypothetical protein Z519_07922 [Cladophialophora bantiana CBS 173.52]